MWAGTLDAPQEHELLLQNAEGSQFPAQLQCGALDPSHTGTTMRIAFFDITERTEAAAEIHRLAYFDALTGLPNRRLLLDRLTQTLATSERERTSFRLRLCLAAEHPTGPFRKQSQAPILQTGCGTCQRFSNRSADFSM